MVTVRKLVKKIAVGLGIIVGLYLLLLFIAGIYFNTKKDSILKSVTARIKEEVRGNATVQNLEISVWRHFPSIDFVLTNFSLSDTIYNIPLLSAKTVASSFNVFHLITSKKEIKNIIIENAVFHLFTDSSGYSNKYLLELKKKPNVQQKTDETSSIEIEDISIKNLEVTIEDAPAKKEISLVVNDLQASIHQDGQLMKIKMNERISMKKGLGFNLERGAYLENQVLEGIWELEMDNATKKLSFNKTVLNINRHPYELTGNFTFDAANPTFSVVVVTKDMPLDNGKAIVTAAIRKKIEQIQLKAPINLQATIDGSLLPNREPLVDVTWSTEKNTLITPVVSFSDCSFTGGFMNSVNKDSAHSDPNSRITLNNFKGNWDGINLAGKEITITNLVDPVIHFDLFSDCNFETLDDKLALKELQLQSGQASLHLFYEGLVTKDKSMLQDVEGEMTVKNGTVLYVPKNLTFTNCNGIVAFFKDSISLKPFSCSYLQNKLDVTIEGKNIRRKFVVGDLSQESTVKCNIVSQFINLEDFKNLFGTKKQRVKSKPKDESFKAIAEKFDLMLENSVIDVQVAAASVKHQHLLATNFEADIKFYPHHWGLVKVSLNLANGTIETKGQIEEMTNSNHKATFSTKINNVNIKKLLYAFDNFGQDAITYQHVDGNFSTTALLKAGISSQGKIISSSLSGTLNFSLKNGALQNYPPLANLKTFVFKDRDLSNIRFAEIKDKIDINGTDVYVNRMEVSSTAFRIFIEGNYGLGGKNTNLLMQVPLSILSYKNFDNESAPANVGVKTKTGASVWLRAVNGDDGKIKVKLTLDKKSPRRTTIDKLSPKEVL